jgi:hypothetical protein
VRGRDYRPKRIRAAAPAEYSGAAAARAALWFGIEQAHASPAHMQQQKKPSRQARQVVPVAQLYAILDREFKARRPPACTTCAVPLP